MRLVAENGTTLLIIPLVGESEIGGAVVVRQPKTGDDPFTQQLAVLFAAQAGPALEQIRVIGKLSEDLRRDDKLGIGNSRHATALVQSLTPGDALVYIDLDNFGDVNEKHGHPGGDRFLREFSDLLSSSVRDSDLTARPGGDEFIFIARDAEFDALPVANRLLQAWRSLRRGSLVLGRHRHPRRQRPARTDPREGRPGRPPGQAGGQEPGLHVPQGGLARRPGSSGTDPGPGPGAAVPRRPTRIGRRNTRLPAHRNGRPASGSVI